MASSKEMTLYEAALEDCDTLLRRFEAQPSVSFKVFAEVWQDMAFSLIFCGHQTEVEKISASSDILRASLSFLLPPTPVSRRLLALYPMYGLYFRQPVRGAAKFRLTLPDWEQAMELLDFAERNKITELVFMFYKLAAFGAFSFTLTRAEMKGSLLEQRVDLMESLLQARSVTSHFPRSLEELLDKRVFEPVNLAEENYSRAKEDLLETLGDVMPKEDDLVVAHLGRRMRNMCLNVGAEELTAKPLRKKRKNKYKKFKRSRKEKPIGVRRRELKNRCYRTSARWQRCTSDEDGGTSEPQDTSGASESEVVEELLGSKRRHRRQRGIGLTSKFRQSKELRGPLQTQDVAGTTSGEAECSNDLEVSQEQQRKRRHRKWSFSQLEESMSDKDSDWETEGEDSEGSDGSWEDVGGDSHGSQGSQMGGSSSSEEGEEEEEQIYEAMEPAWQDEDSMEQDMSEQEEEPCCQVPGVVEGEPSQLTGGTTEDEQDKSMPEI